MGKGREKRKRREKKLKKNQGEQTNVVVMPSKVDRKVADVLRKKLDPVAALLEKDTASG